jgi:hypothetical protein
MMVMRMQKRSVTTAVTTTTIDHGKISKKMNSAIFDQLHKHLNTQLGVDVYLALQSAHESDVV